MTDAPATDAQDAEADGWGAFAGLPGNPMMWILVLGELGVFGAALVGFSAARALDPLGFSAFAAHLHRLLAGGNTLVLVTSGFCVAVAVERRRRGRSPVLALLAGMALGGVFLGVKGVEYGDLFSEGFGVESNVFFELYFLVTGFHAFHVVFGLALLGLALFIREEEPLESGAVFWHMLDMLWALIFPVVYLLR